MTVTSIKKPFVAPKPIRRRISLRTPAGKRVTNFVNVEHSDDPKEDLLRRVGTIPDGVVQFARILVAIYQPPMVTKTNGGIILTDQMSDEDVQEFIHQGKCGLIVAMGPQAYQDDETAKFHGTRNNVGDWVWFRPSDGIGCDVNEVFCRVLTERDIIGKLPHPDMVW